MRFAGATFDPISFYRAAQVFDFFERENLTPNVLRELNQAQTKYFIDKFLALDISEEIIGLAHHVSPEKRAGFVSLHTRQAEDLHKKLLQANVWTDYRGEYLRFGPAPYVSFSQIDEAIKVLKSVL